MTSRERVLAALNHREPDRVPFMYRDIPEVRARLLRDLGLADDEELFRRLGIDFRWVSPAYVGPPLEGGAQSGDYGSSNPGAGTGARRSIFGVEYLYRRGAGGGYWEPASFPLADTEDPEELEEYPWPVVDWFDFSVIAEQRARFEGYAVMSAPTIYTSPGVLTVVQDLFGMEKTLVDMYLNPELWHRAAEKIMEFNLAFLDAFFGACDGRMDFFRIGEDYGTQRGLLFGPDQYREFLKPHNRRMAAMAAENGAYYYQHTCGSVRELIPELIDAGVDVLDPVQVRAEGMDPAALKRDFGDTLCFSGGVDEQELLPNGTAAEVKEGVWRLLDVMAPGGGFFLGPTHNFQEDIPTENIVAMYEAANEYFA